MVIDNIFKRYSSRKENSSKLLSMEDGVAILKKFSVQKIVLQHNGCKTGTLGSEIVSVS